MKKWNRWQDWVAVAVGLITALSPLWTTQMGASTALMVIFGVLLIVSGLINLAMPGMPVVEWAQIVVGLLLFISPWLGGYTAASGAAWTSWIGGAIAVIVTAIAIRPSMEISHHRMMPSH
jgi:hypothetical protein